MYAYAILAVFCLLFCLGGRGVGLGCCVRVTRSREGILKDVLKCLKLHHKYLVFQQLRARVTKLFPVYLSSISVPVAVGG